MRRSMHFLFSHHFLCKHGGPYAFIIWWETGGGTVEEAILVMYSFSSVYVAAYASRCTWIFRSWFDVPWSLFGSIYRGVGYPVFAIVDLQRTPKTASCLFTPVYGTWIFSVFCIASCFFYLISMPSFCHCHDAAASDLYFCYVVVTLAVFKLRRDTYHVHTLIKTRLLSLCHESLISIGCLRSPCVCRSGTV